MATFLLNWNPEKWQWHELPELRATMARNEAVAIRWSSGNRKKDMPDGSRVFLIRQHVEPLGIVASGWTLDEPFEEPHWETERAKNGETCFFIRFRPDVLLDTALHAPMDLRDLLNLEKHWTMQSGGRKLSELDANCLEVGWQVHLRSIEI